MAGPQFKDEQKKESPRIEARRRSVFSSYFSRFTAASLAGVLTFASGTNLNNLGGNVAMAQPQPRRGPAEREDVRGLERAATEAAQAFRDYIIRGEPATRLRFWEIYNRQFGGVPHHDNREFMNRLFQEMDRLRDNADFAVFLDAYTADRDRIWGVRMEPVVMTDFIDTVYNIRQRLEGATASDQAIDALVQRVRDSGTRSAGADTDIGRVRAALGGRRAADVPEMELRDAARGVLERSARSDASERYGERLTQAVAERMPNELARRSVSALREFILTGNQAKFEEFQRIFNSMPWTTVSQRAFTDEFNRRIYHDAASGLEAIATAYNRRQQGQTDPVAFARAVSEIYNLAQSGNADNIERARRQHGTDVVDPLLNIVARGMAGRAVALVRDVLQTGDQRSVQAFANILNGRLAYIQDGQVVVPATVEGNNVFWREFERLYQQEITGNSILSALSRSYQRNILAIAVRDIYIELTRPSPNRARLNSEYGSDLVDAVARNMASMGWMLRNESGVAEELQVRTRVGRTGAVGDETAIALTRMRLPVPQGGQAPPVARALLEVYTAQLDERARRAALGDSAGLDIIEPNIDQLGWLSGNPQDVQRELDRRARSGDALAVALKARVTTDAGNVLSNAYREVRALRDRRQQQAQAYGQAFIDFVSRNMENLDWIVRPVVDVNEQLGSRRTEQAVRAITRLGHTSRTLAHAAREIYAQLGRGAERAGLEQTYGRELVNYIDTNRANLGFLAGGVEAVEREISEGDGQYARGLRGFFYPYTPIQFVSAVARARQAVARGGVVQANARDALGRFFVEPVAARQAEVTPAVSGGALAPRKAEIESRTRDFASDLQNLESQMRHSILAPARPLLERWIRDWRVRSERIRERARDSQDAAELEQLIEEQRTLSNSMLAPADLRRSVEMAFALIHLAETGGDLARAPGGITTTSVDFGTMRNLMDWYRGMQRYPEKQQVVGDIVAAVLGRADAQLYQMITSMDEPGFFQGVQRVFALTSGTSSENRANLVGRYNEGFVRAVEAQAPTVPGVESHLRFLSSPTASMTDLQSGQNALFAGITIRCYRAIANPQPGEDRARMVELFGDEFVRAVEAQRAALAPLATQGASLEDVRRLPSSVRDALMAAYGGAYNRSVRGMLRAYRREDATLFNDVGQVYATLRDLPGDRAAREQRLNELRTTYGRQFVQFVQTNIRQFGFLDSPSARIEDLSRLQPQTLDGLYAAYEQGPGPGRGTFMANMIHMAEWIPRVYGSLRSATLFSNATDTLGTNFAQAVQVYRQEFGSNNYLFNNYFNLPLFSRSIRQLAQRYRGISLPGWAADGLDSPEELARFFSDPAGRQLIQRGREFYDQVEREYLQARTDANFHPTTGDYTDAAVANLRNELSIIDALYLGLAIPEIGGTASSFNRRGAQATMNALLTITHRDPYLVGPFLVQVLPALIQASSDERTLVAAIEAFNSMFVQRYESGMRDISYSTALNRRYFLEVFSRIANRLPEVTSSFDHNQLEDELRLQPEPRTDEGYMNPLLYRYRPGWWQGEGLDPLPSLYGQQGAFPSLLPRPFSETRARMPVPGGTLVLSGADELFGRLYDGVRPPVARMFRQRVPARYRIGALGASTIIRRINELFGPMPTNYSDYWLSAFGEAGAFYGVEGSGGATTQRGGAGGVIGGRTITGGARGMGTYTREQTSAESTGTGGERSATTTTRDVVDVTGQAAQLPYNVAGIIPLAIGPQEGTGIHRARTEFHYENAGTSTQTTPTGGPTTVVDQQTSGRTRGLLETYSRIAQTNQTDMLLFVAGEHVPELRGPDGTVTQQGEDRLKTRLFFVTQEGNIYQLAYGLDTRAQLLNYLYAGANTQQFLAGVRTLGRGQLTGDSAAAGFDGAAVGFTVPREGGDSFSALALGELVRNMSTMDPVHAEQAAGMAVTALVRDRRARDVYAAFYRGAQIVTMDPADHTRVSDTRWAQGTGELMWRRVRIDPMEHQMELRVVGGATRTREGYGPVVGARWRHEIPQSRHRRVGYGLMGAFNDFDMLREFRAVDQQADQIYARMRTVLANFYHWSEDDARDTGYLVAGSYMYARMEDWTVRDPTSPTGYRQEAAGPEGNPAQHYASAMFMYWAQRHGLLMGAQRVPGFSRLYDRIDQAMLQIQQNPTNEATILQNLSSQLRSDLTRDIWRFALAWGYDGERVRTYIVGSGQYSPSDETSYGSLYGLFLFGRPTQGYADILTRAYGYSPLVISENPGVPGGFQVQRGRYTPYADIYTGFGLVDWPSFSLQRYEREATMSPRPDHSAALRHVYLDIGSMGFDRTRLARIYGRDAVSAIVDHREDFSWMVRPRSEVQEELERRRRDDDSLATQITALRRDNPAAAIIDIFTELRKTAPDRARLEREYTRDLVELVERRSSDLDWMLLPPDRMRTQLRTRAGRSGTPEAALVGASIPVRAARADLTGPELKTLFEQNMVDVLVGMDPEATRRDGRSPERYDVLLAPHIASPEGSRARHTTFYVLHTPITDRPDARGSIVIGDEQDYDEWQRNGNTIGRGVTRIEVNQSGENYRVVFSGDRRLRAFTAERFMGGITVPIGPSDAPWNPQGNWSVGGLIHLLQDHRHDLLAGAFFGSRQYGNERWDQWTITASHRFQSINTATMTEQLYSYAFFNRTTRQVVFASGDVFNNREELANVCRSLSGGQCSDLTELRRTTGGAGLTWARADLIRGDRMAVHFFFEAGAEERREYAPTAVSGVTRQAGDTTSFIGRIGIGWDYQLQNPTSVLPTRYNLTGTAYTGSWPLLPGEVLQPEMLRSWGDSLRSYPGGWGLMLYGTMQW